MEKIISLLKNPRVSTSVASWLALVVVFALGYFGVELKYLIPIYLAGMVIGGFFFAREAMEKLFEKRKIGIELLMSVGIIGAAALGEWREALLLVGLYSISEAIESYTTDKTRNAIRALMELVPQKALVKRNGKEELIPAENLRVGDIFIVKVGESIATDGAIKKGSASINQAPITGESIPVFKQVGDQVFAGTINEDGLLEVEVVKPFRENTISKIIHLVEEAQKEKGRRQQMVEKFGNWYSPAVLFVALGIVIIPILFGNQPFEWLERAILFIIGAEPAVLAISVPIAFAAAIGTAARNGVLIKGGVYLEALAETKKIAFDKTGTLTTGHPEVTDVLSLNKSTPSELLQIAGGLSAYSPHPLDRAISKKIQEENIKPSPYENYQSIAGSGIKGEINKEVFYLGSPDWFRKLGHQVNGIKEFGQFSSEGKTVVFVGTEKKLYGLLAIADAPRTEAGAIIKELHELGIDTIMLTGDNTLVAKSIGQKLGIDTIFAELKPDAKVDKIKELKSKYQNVAMVGDGVNDAPALAESSVGLAMGTAGTDAALEAANVALMGDDLTKVPYAIRLARFTKKVVLQNLFFSVVLLITTISLAVGAVLPMSGLLLIHEGGEVLVVLNGLRLLKGRT